jgi:hypothetical protein
MRAGKIIALVIAIGIVVFSSAPLASAQHLIPDEVWLKLKVSVKGSAYSTDSSPFEPFNYNGTHYVRITPTANAYEHNWQTWSFLSNFDSWGVSTNSLNTIIGDGNGLVHGWSTTFHQDQASLGASINATIKINLDGASTKSAKFTSTGCTVWGYTGGGVYPYYSAGCKLTGKKIDPSKLPFTP